MTLYARVLRFAISAVVLAPVSLGADPAHAKEPPAKSNAGVSYALTKKLNAALAAPVLRHAIVGVLVRSLDDGRVVYQRNADVALMPASNMKVLTAAAALAKLGVGYRFTTTLYRTGTIDKDGTLRGDLYLRGTGDPGLTSEHLLGMATALKAAGVTKFGGRIIADATRFDDRYLGEGWQWDDESFYFQPQVAALNCDENLLVLHVRPGRNVGDPAEVLIGGEKSAALGFAGTTYVTLANTATTAAGGVPSDVPRARVTVDRARARNEISVGGTVPLNAGPATEEVTVEDPPRFAATRLYELLPVVGIAVPSQPEKRPVEKGKVPADAVVVAEKQSEEFPKLLGAFLKPSDNLYGECLLKALGAEKGGGGSTAAGAKVVREFLKEARVSDAGLYIADGSGLSRFNNVTARLLIDLLTCVDRRFPADVKRAFVEALPAAGLEGTLRNRFKRTAVEGRLRAKTGSLTGASALSGYLTASSGERFVFSILMNHFHGTGSASAARAAQNAFILALAASPHPDRRP